MRTLPIAILLLPCALSAQSGGPVLAVPSGFSIDPLTTLTAGDPAKIELDDAGIDGVLPMRRTPTFVVPDFATYLGGAAVDVDAFSLGYDWVVSNVSAEAVVAPPQWAGITYTVSRATVGKPGSLLETESTTDGAAADVFAYLIPGSAAPPALVGEPFRSKNSDEIADFGTAAPNIDAHDLYVALIYQENPQIAALLPPPTIYFSVTAGSVASVPPAWLTAPGSASGATVFATTWLPGSGTWSSPTVAFTPLDLGLDISEDLDALALDLLRSRALLSTDPLLPPPIGPARNPILHTLLGTGVLLPYKLPGGSPISDEIGLDLGTDDIDGICALDPGDAGTPSPVFLDAMLSRIEQPLPIGLQPQLSATAWRQLTLQGNLELASCTMVGLPSPGPAQPGFAISAASATGPGGPYIVLDAFLRPDPAIPFDGQPHRTSIVIPPSHSLTGLPLHFIWGAFDNNNFVASHPVGFVL